MAIQDIKNTPGYTPNPVVSPEPASPGVPQGGVEQVGTPSPTVQGSGGFSVPVQEDGGQGVAATASDQTDVDAVQIDSQGIAAAVSGLFPQEDDTEETPLESEEEVQADIDQLQTLIENQEIVAYEGTPIYNAASPKESPEPERLTQIDLGKGSVLQTLAPTAYPQGPIHRRPVPAQRVVEGVPPPDKRKPSFINGILGFKDVVDQVHDAIPKTRSELPTPAPLNLPALTPSAPAPASNRPASTPPVENALKQGLIDRGLPEHVAEGFVMNFKDESGLDPDINEKAPLVKGSRGGYGLYQLTGPRRVRYEAYASARGVPTSSVDAQLDFLVHELKTTEKKAAGHILRAGTSGEAAAEIVSRFLRPSIEHKISRRARYLSAS